MREIPKCYTVLFNAVEEAVRQLEQHNYGAAREILLHGQLQAESEAAGGERKES